MTNSIPLKKYRACNDNLLNELSPFHFLVFGLWLLAFAAKV